VDDVGPLVLGDELARHVFRQAILYPVEDLIEPPGCAEPFQLLRSPAELVLWLGKRDAADEKKLRVFKKELGICTLKNLICGV
jgi:hypothetical protein